MCSSDLSWTRGSIASLFTGTYAWTHGVHDRKDSLSPVPPTLAELLRGAHYRTGGIISNPNIDVRFGFERGIFRCSSHIF